MLVANNQLYEKIRINFLLLETWEDKFIPSDIMDNIIYCNFNHHECEGYAADLYDSNYENNPDVAITGTSIVRNDINTSCIYSDIDDGWQNLTLRLLSTITNIKVPVSTLDQPISTIISFCNRDQLILLNDWNNPHYFTSAFLYLFSFGTGGHLKKQKKPMSLEA